MTRERIKELEITLVEVGVAIMDSATDTVWLSRPKRSETAIERICSALGIGVVDFEADLRQLYAKMIPMTPLEVCAIKCAVVGVPVCTGVPGRQFVGCPACRRDVNLVPETIREDMQNFMDLVTRIKQSTNEQFGTNILGKPDVQRE